MFQWAERGRASRLAHRPVSPPADPELAALLGRLRAAARAGGAGQLALERRIRDLYRVRGHRAARPVGRPATPAELREPLGERALVEFVRVNGDLLSVTLVDGKLSLRHIGPTGEVADLVERMGFALHRLARPHRAPAAAELLLADAAARLDALLLTGVPDRPLVVVPTGALHGAAWSLLPSCAGRPVTVAPSATLWLAATGVETSGDVAVAAGPGLSRAEAEARAVAAIHGADPLLGERATAPR
ncbi:hypothetical protein ACFQV2_10575 [Actinokineospora soli]|uniref:Uncharacterized protein n=1 Tax=Actinokineospora soli TaxID=1048753 RepID=A0ABW2TJJ5_9PSEU